MKKSIKEYIFLIAITIILLITLIHKASSKQNNSYLASGRTILIENDSFSMSMDMEQFIPLVLMAEMPYDSPKELLKAQAVVIRTNILHAMGGNKEITAKKLGLPYKTPSQLKELWFKEEKLVNMCGIRSVMAHLVGVGKGKIYTDRMDYLYEIIRETEGKVLKIEGKVILPLFHEVSNGKTRSGKEILGESYRYLKSVPCDEDMENNAYEQYKEMTVSEIFDALNSQGIVIFKDGEEIKASGINADDFLNMLDTDHKDEMGYITYVVLGDVKIDGNDFANALGLESPAMDIDCENEKVCFITRGIGHGFGMSLNYAKVMAGKGESYEKILKTFYDAALVRSNPSNE